MDNEEKISMLIDKACEIVAKKTIEEKNIIDHEFSKKHKKQMKKLFKEYKKKYKDT